ncbi:MAG: alpha/beta hydrolase [Bernardetiaceae bacterium]|nr:alpha/beta hydrolase [Bernardetiaceae bacterium]
MELQIKDDGKFQYIDEGEGEVLLLLHGLFGALSNWKTVVNHFSKNYRVIIPMMPIYTMSLRKADLKGLVNFIEDFIETKKIENYNLIGNSLGGHIALLYTLKAKQKVRRMVLTGSSGLFENGMGGSYPKRGDYGFIQERVAYTFYDPNLATKDLVDDVYNITTTNSKCLRMISIARSAQRNNLSKEITKIDRPTLLVWGLNDTITPPVVAHEFNRLLPNSELRFIDRCGHAPMMEHPELFNQYLENFLQRTADEVLAI